MNNQTQPTEPIISDEELKIPQAAVKKETHLVAILGVLIILLILIFAGLYLWTTTLVDDTTVEPAVTRPTAAQNNEPESTNAEAEVETMQALSPSNDLNAIEADLESTNIENLDAELTAIDTELESSE